MLTIPSNHIRIGDLARFPIGRLGDPDVYRHRWIVVAFVTNGGNCANAIVCRRLADGREKTIGFSWWDRYAIDPRAIVADDARDVRIAARAEGLAKIKRRRVAEAFANLQHDPDRPGFFVSARKGQQTRFLLGPFVDHYSALQLVEPCRRIAQRYSDPYCEIGYGTCKASPVGSAIGIFNTEVFGK